MKYSIIIPVHNGLKYLPTCIETIINQDYDNYELIISDDNSTDGTKEFLNSLKSNPNIKIVFTKKRLTVVEHFEWAYKHSCGEWVMFLGSDDGLQRYFFKLSDQLTKLAEENKLKVIMSKRAYYFWEGCESLYGNLALKYVARKEFKILNSKFEALKALLGVQSYFELPEMYATSLFKRIIIDKAISLQGGRIFSTVPPDANLAAIAISLEKKYIKSFIPLGWIGTSSSRTMPSTKIPENGIIDNGIEYEKTCGHFNLGSSALYFLNSLLRTNILRDSKINNILKNKFFKILIFTSVFGEVSFSKNHKKVKHGHFKNLISINNLNYKTIKFFALLIIPFIFTSKALIFIIEMFKNKIYKSFSIKRERKDQVLMNFESIKIHENLVIKNII